MLPPSQEATVPSTWNQQLCDISPRNKGTTSTAGTALAAALVVMNPWFLQLPHATGSDEFSSPSHPAGHVLAHARHMGQLWVSSPRLWEGAWATLMGFTGGCPLVPRGCATSSQTLCGSLSSLPAAKWLLQLIYWAKAETGPYIRTPHGLPWPCCPCNALWGRKKAGLQPEQDSNEFLVTEGPVGSGPWLLTAAPHALQVAQMPSWGPGPGLSASRIPGKQAQGVYVEGPSSAHSGGLTAAYCFIEAR